MKFRTNIKPAVPPDLLYLQSLYYFITLLSLQLEKCYSRKFILQGSHCPLLTGSDKVRYCSSS